MRLLIQLILILLLFLAAMVGAVAWKAVPQLQFEQRDMDWQWHWSYFHPFSNGIQQARTQDTKQLLLRRVYLEESLAIGESHGGHLQPIRHGWIRICGIHSGE